MIVIGITAAANNRVRRYEAGDPNKDAISSRVGLTPEICCNEDEERRGQGWFLWEDAEAEADTGKGVTSSWIVSQTSSSMMPTQKGKKGIVHPAADFEHPSAIANVLLRCAAPQALLL